MAADIVQMLQCRSNSEWATKIKGSTGNVYTVTFGPVIGQKYSHGYTCTCPGFKFHGTCKHTARASNLRCGWHEQFDAGEAQNGKCPRCGGKVEAVMVAV